MKLQYVFFFLQPQWEEESRKLEDELRQKGIVCIRLKKMEEIEYPSNSILITDDRAFAKRIKKQQTDAWIFAKRVKNPVCVGCDRESFSFFDGAELVTDDPGSLDAQTLDELFCHTHGYPVTVACTDRLELREISEPDFDRLYEISRQEHMRYAWSDCEAADVFERDRLLAYTDSIYRLCGYGLWGVWKKDGHLIGCCGLMEQEERLELQYMLEESFQGQGYALEMCKAALQCAALRTDWQQIWIRVDRRNVRSRKLAERLGFVLSEKSEKEVLLYQRCMDSD